MKPLTLFHDLLKSNAVERGRLLGLDVGDKYVGLAVSDPRNKIASPLRYVNFWYLLIIRWNCARESILRPLNNFSRYWLV